MASFNPCRRGQPAPTFVHETHARSPSASSKGWATTAIVVGSLAVIVLGAIGTAGFLHSSGIISSFPNSFSWIANVGTIGHGVMLGGAGLGIVAIAVGGTKCHQARMAEKAQAGRRSDNADRASSARREQPAERKSVWQELGSAHQAPYQAMQQGEFAVVSQITTDTHPQFTGNTFIITRLDSGLAYMLCRSEKVESTLRDQGLAKQYTPTRA